MRTNRHIRQSRLGFVAALAVLLLTSVAPMRSLVLCAHHDGHTRVEVLAGAAHAEQAHAHDDERAEHEHHAPDVHHEDEGHHHDGTQLVDHDHHCNDRSLHVDASVHTAPSLAVAPAAVVLATITFPPLTAPNATRLLQAAERAPPHRFHPTEDVVLTV